LAQVENLPHITEIQRIMQNYIHFWRKNFALRLHLQTTLQIFIHLIIMQLQYIFCVFAFLHFCMQKMYG
jgi:hypothetical protein